MSEFELTDVQGDVTLTLRDLSSGAIHKLRVVLDARRQQSGIEFDGKLLPNVKRLRFAVDMEAMSIPQIELELDMFVVPSTGGDN